MVDTHQAQEILIEEMEKLLDSAAPEDADSAALYVEVWAAGIRAGKRLAAEVQGA